MQVGFHQRETCPLCQSEKHRKLCEISYREPQLAGFIEQFYQGRVPSKVLESETYRVVACADCDFIFQSSILDAGGMQSLYRDWIDQQLSLRKKQTAGARLYRQYTSQIQALLRLTGQRPDQTRVLEFGMGWGYWSRMAQAHGVDVTGVELSAHRREHARQMGVNACAELTDGEAEFDCIYANQVFEHLPDPVETLNRLRLRLKPGGIIYIRVPDGRGIDSYLTRRGWAPHLDAIHPFEHINCFTRSTLIHFAAGAGLTPVNPPPRLCWGSLWGGIRREFADRFMTTHVYFRS